MFWNNMRWANLKILALWGLISWVLVSCNNSFADTITRLPTRVLSSPPGDYIDVAWLEGDLFAFEYASRQSNRMPDYQVTIYAPDANDWRILPVHKPDECTSAWNEGPVQRLPNGNLGFLHWCSLKSHGEYETLYMWDKQTGRLQVLQRYPREFFPANYTFAPQMSELIQENAVGPKLSNQLYHVEQNGQMERILSNFQRAQAPTWCQ